MRSSRSLASFAKLRIPSASCNQSIIYRTPLSSRYSSLPYSTYLLRSHCILVECPSEHFLIHCNLLHISCIRCCKYRLIIYRTPSFSTVPSAELSLTGTSSLSSANCLRREGAIVRRSHPTNPLISSVLRNEAAIT